MLGVDYWRIHDLIFPPVPWDAPSTEAKLTVGFGRVAGCTFELLQVREGRTIHLDFLESRGEGVQHIGLSGRPSSTRSVGGARITGAPSERVAATSIVVGPKLRGVELAASPLPRLEFD
jgi:hypothetical protein